MDVNNPSVFDDVKYEYHLEGEWIKKAQDELNENPATVRQEIQQFRNRVQASKNLHCRLDDCFLLSFLRSKKFNQDKAYKTLKKFCELRKTYSECFELLLPSEHREIYYEKNMFLVLREKDHLGRTTVIINIGDIDLNVITADQIWRGVFTSLDAQLLDQTFQVGGYVLVLDFAGMGMCHVKLVTIKFLRMFCQVMLDTYPVRFKAMHFLNTPYYFDLVFPIFKAFLSKKMQGRLTVHGPKESIFDKNIKPEILPKEYGGTADFDNSWWLIELGHLESTLREMAKYDFSR